MRARAVMVRTQPGKADKAANLYRDSTDAAEDLRGWDRPAIIRVVRDIELEGREGTEPHWTAWRILEQLAATPASDRWLAEPKLATFKGAEPGHTAAALRLLTVDVARLRGAPESFVEVRERGGGRSCALREAAAPIVRAALVTIAPETA